VSACSASAIKREPSGGAAIGGYLLAAGGFPGIGYLCLGAVAFSVFVIVFFLREPARLL